MADALMVQPDHAFIREVIRDSGGELKKCFQCATCSSVCAHSTEVRPFPRKQMLEAQWGMGNRLLGDPAIWLCHDCGDCTARCPRGARPSAVMDAIRLAVIKRIAFPRFMGSVASNLGGAVLLFIFSALLLLSIAVLPLGGSFARPLIYGEMFPKARLEPMFYVVGVYVAMALLVGMMRLVRALRATGVQGAILPALLPALIEITLHRRFASCGSGQIRRWGHLLVFSAFLGLAVMGTAVGVGSMLGLIDTPLPMLHPLKVFANLCALVLAVGAAILVWVRWADQEKRAGSSFGDWYFLVLLGGVGFTGILTEAVRMGQNLDWMFTIYFIHLCLVLTLFLSTPYSKFAHFLYRTIAMAAAWQESQSPARGQAVAGGPDVALPEGPGLPHVI